MYLDLSVKTFYKSKCNKNSTTQDLMFVVANL